MTAKEFKEKTIAIVEECTGKLNELRKQYAMERNPVKVGDIVTDHFHAIRVESMDVCSTAPYMRYSGIELTKQGVPKKHQLDWRRHVDQVSVESINGEPYKYEEEQL